MSAVGDREGALPSDDVPLRLLLDAVQDYAIYRLDRAGCVASWNEGARRIQGYEAREVIGRHVSIFYPPEDVASERPARGLAIAADTGRFEDEGWRVRKDGSRFWASVLVTAVRGERGELLGFAKVTRDISERRGAEQRFRGLLDAAPDPMIISDAAGRIIVINARAEQLFGYEAGELSGCSVDVLIPERLHVAHAAFRDKFFRNPRVRPMGSGLEVEAVRKDGSEFPVEISLSPIATDDRLLVASTVIDITERKRAESTLREAEERFRVAIDEAPIGMALVGLSGRFLRVNRALCRIVGYTPEELTGLTFQEITHPDDLDSVALMGELVSGKAASAQRSKRYFHKSGAVIDIMLNVALVRDRNGAPLHFIAQMEDITARIRAEAAIRELQAQIARQARTYRTIVESLPNSAIYLLDKEMRYASADGPALGPILQSAGMTRADLVGRSAEEVAAGSPNRAMILDVYRQALEGRPRTIEVARDDRTFELSTLPMRDDAGDVSGALVFCYDVTELKRTQEALTRERQLLQAALLRRQRAEAELQRRNGELQEFAMVASHDLQEPLRKVRIFADRLKDEFAAGLEPTARDYVDRMQSAAVRGQALIHGLLDYSRVTSRGRPPTLVDLNVIAREVVEDLEARLAEVRGEVEVAPLPTIQADPLQMRQLFQNLIGNALKFRRDAVPPRVRLRATPLDPSSRFAWEIAFEDNGIGFEEQYSERIFKLFQRLHDRAAYEGAGMGLAICRKIMERHGGTIAATSVPGKGSTFLVKFLSDRRSSEQVPHASAVTRMTPGGVLQ